MRGLPHSPRWRSLLLFSCVLPALSLAQGSTPAVTGALPDTQLEVALPELLRPICQGSRFDAESLAPLGELRSEEAIVRRGNTVAHRYTLSRNDKTLELTASVNRGNRGFTSLVARGADGAAETRLDLDRECAVAAIRLVDFDQRGNQRVPRLIREVDINSYSAGQFDAEHSVRHWVNPPLSAETGPVVDSTEKIRIAMVDSGVNYLLPEIRTRLARDEHGQLIGHDFWDQDDLPFDANLVGGGFHVQRHGTRTASLALREAPDTVLVPYRYPRPDMTRMRALVEHAVRHDVHIIGMPLGSERLTDWQTFQSAAEAHPEVLFIVSAGNNGRNIEERPLFPATLDIANLLVVSSADDFVRPAAGTNWGRLSVDFLLPAENQTALDFSGEDVRVSGSSYAVSRMVALAARIQQAHPHWRARQIIKALQNRYTDGVAKRWVYSGYIADPLAWNPPVISSSPVLLSTELKQASIRRAATEPAASPWLDLPLDALILDPAWEDHRVQQVMIDAMSVLAQCKLMPGHLGARRISAPDYLRDLATGPARTLMDALRTDAVTVVFARDTRMQEPYTGEAFGRANTRDRPWLTHSVWLTADVEDAALALAHELVHVLSNSGEHTEQAGNLMQRRTAPGQHGLSVSQCQRMRENALAVGLAVERVP